MTDSRVLTASHWGAGHAEVRDGRVVAVHPPPGDPDASPINGNISGSLTSAARVRRPAVRKSWLDGNRDAVPRGRDAFVEVDWDQALDLVAAELTRVRTRHGNTGIYAGSYGWASAGRFHHAQSQLKRFLNTQGGFVSSEGNYSYNAALVTIPHIVGPFYDQIAQATRWRVIAEHSDLVVAFGGLASRNTQVVGGGVGRHMHQSNLRACVEAGVSFVNISPLRSDTDAELGATWMPARPGSDTALMLGLAHVLLTEGLHDTAFLERYTTGFDRFAAYLTGKTDGLPKSPDWATRLCGLSAEDIRALARRMAASRTMISVAAGVQRTDYGEQPLWMTVTLAAMLGQIGLPGGGFVIGYAVNATVGNTERPVHWASMPQGRNPVRDFIPVAMISEMLLSPGASYQYNGQTRTFPDARLVWWAGGNPFHHHQDLNRLHRAFQTPETIIVNEIGWTATARHADIVLPVAAPQERLDFGAGNSDAALVPMPQLTAPVGDARCEYDIFADLAARMGNAEAFTEGRTAEGWVRHLWGQTQERAAAQSLSLPDWDDFIQGDIIHLEDPAPDNVYLAAFRADPEANPLKTPSGRIEIFSEVVAGFDLPDCPGHATWFPPRDLTEGTGSLALLSGQPLTRLHSQLDDGDFSLSRKIGGREPVLIHPGDAAARGISDGDIVELSNARGRCLAGARITDEILPGCVFLWTGAWWDPEFEAPQARDRHGNPNVLTHDLRTSSLSQSPAAHSTRVDLQKAEGPLSDVQAHKAPRFVPAPAGMAQPAPAPEPAASAARAASSPV